MKKSDEPVYTPPPRVTVFTVVRKAVMRGSDCIAPARSHTFARRIANALNQHTPNRRGY